MSLKKPRSFSMVPNGDWRYRQPETDTPFVEIHWKALQMAVWDHRNSVPELNLDRTGGWLDRLWSDVCEQNPQIDCVDCEDPGRYPNLVDAWNWIQSMTHWASMGFPVATQEEAERRAAICVSCPLNKAISSCWGCRGVGEAVSALSGNRTTSLDGKLHACSACGCVLRAKVHLPREVINAEPYAHRLSGMCWLKDQSPHPSPPIVTVDPI